MNSAVFLTVFVVMFLVATSSHVSAECSVPFMIGGSFGDCSASSTAMSHFDDSINVVACRLFGNMDFTNSTNLTNSWPDITDSCILQLELDIRALLYHSTVRGPGQPLNAAQCQIYYDQTMQCRMDCLLTFLLSGGSMELFGYLHLRAISCNETLFSTSINTIFNNANGIQPSFISRQPMNNSSVAMFVSSATITSSSPSLLPSPITSTAAIQVTQQPAQSTSSATSSIIPPPSSTQPQSTPAPTPTNTQCTEETDPLCQNNRDCGNSQFSTALTAACASDHTPVLTVKNSSVDSVLDCTAAHQLFKRRSTMTCNTMPKFRNITCDCGDSCLTHVPPSSSSCSSSCILWFENITGSGNIFVIIRNVIPGENSLMELIGKTCNEGNAPPSEMLISNCCPSGEGFATSQIIAAAAIGGGVLLGLLLILVLVCCCCCTKYKNRRAKAIITGDNRTTVHVAAANPSFGPTSPCSTLELGVMPPFRQHPNPEVATVIDNWKKVIRRVFSLHDICIGEPIGEGAFGQVHQGQLIRKGSSKPHQVAIKTLKKAYSPEEVDDFISESAIMLDFDHPNVLQLLGVCFDTQDHLPLIVLPYMANGDLRSFLKSKRQQSNNNSIMPEGISINILLDMCLDIATGMEYLAINKFVHRDLAARNCMVNEALEVKVADFGLSRDMYTKNYYRMESRKKLPIKWMAPECLNDTMYDEMTDVWSFGVTCWEIFTLGHTPYASVDNPDILDFIVERGRRLAKPPFSPMEIWVLMQQCWLIEPANRPKFTSLKESICQISHHYRYQTVTHSASPIVSPGCYAQPYLFPDQLQDTSEGESSDSSSSPSTAKVAAIPMVSSGGDNHRLSSVSTISGEYNHLGHLNSSASGSSGVHFMSSVEASAMDTSFNGGDSKVSQGITVTPERNEYTNVIIRDPNTEPSYNDRGRSLADTGRHSITMPPAPHHYFMLDPDAVKAQRTYHTGTL